MSGGFVAACSRAAGAMYWGGTIKGDVYGVSGEAPTSASVWERFERDAGKSVTFVNTGESWGSFDTPTMQAAIDGGAIPLVTMGLPANVTLQEVAEGRQDAQIREWARRAAAWGYPFLFRPWREMNGDWYSWGRNPYFVAAWRHFHDLVVEEGATNVTWAWIVNTIWSDPESNPAPYYPGDAYVDWVGMDAYNWGRNPIQPDRWLTPAQAIGPTLRVLEEVAPDKPVALTEVASTEYGGNKASWIRDFLGSYLPDHPDIKAMLWFNWNVESGGQRYDWPIESSVPAEQAFRDGIQGGEYLSQLPPLTRLTKVPMPAWPGPAEPAAGVPGPTRVADGVWSPAVRLGEGVGDGRGARVAVGPEGALIAVWEHYDGSNFVVDERQIGEGGLPMWPVHQLSAPGGDAFDARVAVGADGTATVVWKRFDDSSSEPSRWAYVIQERRIAPGGSPDASVHDLSLPGQFSGQPEVAATPNGGAVVVWESYNGYRTRIQSTAIHPDGTAAACCYELSDPQQNAVQPQVAVAPDGSATVVWDRNDGSGPGEAGDQIVQARRLEPGGAPAATTYDLSAAEENAIEPKVAIGPDGTETVIWTRFDGSAYVVQARRLNTAGEPGPAAADVSEGGPAVEPHLVELPDGSASVVWEQLEGGKFVVEERRLEAGGAAAPTTYDLSAAGADAREPQAAVGPAGIETVAWDRVEGDRAQVRARRIGPEGVPETVTASISKAGEGLGGPFVAAGENSTAAVVWRRFDGAEDHVRISVFGVPAVSLGPDSADFGSLVAGAGASQPRSFVIANPGNGDLSISSIALEGAGAAQFQLLDTAPCARAVLAPGETCQFSVSFAPTAAGRFPAQLRVLSDASYGTGTVALLGVGEAPQPTAGSAGPGGAPISAVQPTAAPSNAFRLGRIRLDRSHGSARVPVWLPGPGTLQLAGRGVAVLRQKGGSGRSRPAEWRVAGRGTLVLHIGATGRKRAALLAHGSAKIVARLSYVPSGGARRTKALVVRLRVKALPAPPGGR